MERQGGDEAPGRGGAVGIRKLEGDLCSHRDQEPDQVKEEYIKHYIHGLVGKHTWKEELRGYAVDHTQAADRGPLSPTLTGKLPPINVNYQEALLLGKKVDF